MTKEISLPQDAVLMYPPDRYQYIAIYFDSDDDGSIYPCSSPSIDGSFDTKKCYFIFNNMNWYYKNEIRRQSNFFSDDTYNEEFSFFYFKKGIANEVLEAIVDENGELIDLNTEEDKEKIKIPIIDYAIAKFIEKFTQKSNFKIDLDKLSKDIHAYFRYNAKREANKPTGFLKPQMPSAVMLKSLMDQFPGKPLEELMDIDENMLQMLEMVATQQEVFRFERDHINESVMQSQMQQQAMKSMEKQGGGNPNIPANIHLHSMSGSNPSGSSGYRVPVQDATK